MERSTQETRHCQGLYICLVGDNLFQNEMFASNLIKIHGCKCTFDVASSLSNVPLCLYSKLGWKGLICIDGFGLENHELEDLLHTVDQKGLSDNLLVLFNLKKDTVCENTSLALGVRGFFYSNDSPIDFCRGIKALSNGEVWLSRKMMSEALTSGPHRVYPHRPPKGCGAAKLTSREKEILVSLATGASNEAISIVHFISVHTVRTHLYNIYQKINVKNRMQASIWASENL